MGTDPAPASGALDKPLAIGREGFPDRLEDYSPFPFFRKRYSTFLRKIGLHRRKVIQPYRKLTYYRQ